MIKNLVVILAILVAGTMLFLSGVPFQRGTNAPGYIISDAFPSLSKLEFPCAGAQKIWESRVEAGYRNNCAIRLASELRLLGLTADETKEKLAEWNEKKGIELPVHELEAVVHSAYQHQFPYRYSCHDEILRHFCPLNRYSACQTYVAKQSDKK